MNIVFFPALSMTSPLTDPGINLEYQFSFIKSFNTKIEDYLQRNDSGYIIIRISYPLAVHKEEGPPQNK